jgi:hypothetical protein
MVSVLAGIVLRPPNVPAFSCERQREAGGRAAALVSCNALLASLTPEHAQDANEQPTR